MVAALWVQELASSDTGGRIKLTLAEYINPQDLKLILVGALGTALAGAIAAIAKKYSASASTVVWNANHWWLRHTDEKKGNQSLDFNLVFIENTSRATAKEIEIFIPVKIQHLEISRYQRTWRSVKAQCLIRKDESPIIEQIDERTKIKINNLTNRTYLECRYTCNEGFGHTEPSAVHYDGKIAKELVNRIWFMTKPDALIRILLDNFFVVPTVFAFIFILVYWAIKP
jgi:hypothetical protein